MLKIRSLRSNDDVERLYILSKLFFEEYEHHDNYLFKISKISKKFIIEYFDVILKSKDKKCYVATDDELIVGYIIISIKQRPKLYAIKNFGYISGLMIDNKYRNKRVATALLEESKKWFKNKKIGIITVETSNYNRKAISFYKNNNFKIFRQQMYSQI